MALDRTTARVLRTLIADPTALAEVLRPRLRAWVEQIADSVLIARLPGLLGLGPPLAANSGGATVLLSTILGSDYVPVAAQPIGSVLRVTWSGDSGIFGFHGLFVGGAQTLWILADGSADWGGAPPSVFTRWTCAGGVLTLWLDAANTTCHVIVEKIR